MNKFGFAFAAAVFAAGSGVAVAQNFPTRDIDLVVPFEPGGAVDATSRIIAEAANTLLDGSVGFTVSNRAGGGGVVGQTYAAQAEPDGYTVLAITSSVVTNPQLKGASYSVEDFVPVGLYNLDPEVIAVPASSPFETVEAFLAAASQKPLNMVIAGIGTSHHMAGMAVERKSDATFNYVPTRGFGKQLQAVMGGHVDGAFWPMGEASSHAQSGGVKILAVASDERDPNFPDVPTFQEAGLDIPIWATFRGWSVPKGTPEEIVARLSGILGQVSEMPDYKAKMSNAGYKPIFRDAKAFQSVVDDYAAQASAIIEENKLGK